MAIIKVICGGCGIIYKDSHGVERHALKTAESGAFECDDNQAQRLVSRGVAEYVGTKKPETETPPAAVEEKPDANTGETPDNTPDKLDLEQLNSMSFNDLKALASDMGADIKGCKSKADYIKAIEAVEVEAGDDDLPDLTAADPE